ncbi:CRISP/Allergen/PR-1-like [Amblyomma americanum]
MYLDSAEAACRPEYQNRPGGITHTACKPPNPRCKIDAAISGLSAAIKAQALQTHNDYRSRIAQGRLAGYPTAKNMYKMEWDDELAEVAQAFTDQCDFSKHDHRDARITSRFTSVGQNFGWAVDSSKQTVTEAKSWIGDWFIEYRSFNRNAISSFQAGGGGVVTHFTQMSWAETRYVGCGFTNYELNGRLMRLFACNYAPSGNLIGSPVYLPGPTCNACPSGSTCESNSGLCSSGGSGRPPLPPRGSPPVPPGGHPPYPPRGQLPYPPQHHPPYDTSGRGRVPRDHHKADQPHNIPARDRVSEQSGDRTGSHGRASDNAGDADSDEDSTQIGTWLLAAAALVISFLSGVCVGGSFAYMFKKDAPLNAAGGFGNVPASAWALPRQ